MYKCFIKNINGFVVYGYDKNSKITIRSTMQQLNNYVLFVLESD